MASSPRYALVNQAKADIVSRLGAQIACLQEIFYRPYFCAEQETRWYDFTEAVPDGPTIRQMQEVARKLHLAIIVPKGLFPQQDTGRMVGGLQADQSISFQMMRQKLRQFVRIVGEDPAVASVVGFTGGGQTNSGFMFVALKPLAERDASVSQVIGRLRPKLGQVAGARLFLQPVQDIRVGGRQSNALYQYTLQSDDLNELYNWSPKVTDALERVRELTEVNSDQQ